MPNNNIKLVSLDVNEMNNPVKRSKVLAKLKKEKAQVLFLGQRRKRPLSGPFLKYLK